MKSTKLIKYIHYTFTGIKRGSCSLEIWNNRLKHDSDYKRIK